VNQGSEGFRGSWIIGLPVSGEPAGAHGQGLEEDYPDHGRNSQKVPTITLGFYELRGVFRTDGPYPIPASCKLGGTQPDALRAGMESRSQACTRSRKSIKAPSERKCIA